MLALALCAGCGGSGPGGAAERAAPPAPPPAPRGDATTPAPAAPDGGGDLPVVVFLGDSLTAGLGVEPAQAWPALVEERLAAEGHPFHGVDAGVSGDTSAGGLARVDWALRSRPDVVVVELGANDGLRGLDLDMTESNLRRIVARVRRAGARVLLVGMRIPPNYGPGYTERFHDLYPRLAAELGVPLVPFLLEGVGGEPDLNQADGLHPNAAGHRRVAATVAPYLLPLVSAAEAETTAGAAR